ncbi:preprotein translocase subunit SecG [Spiribacter sp. C176]|uniref:Protein-export membrane protein SecG n=1 Tax=Spiribacter salilacus TaxID=2664894 RepID=A0A6N7QT58_9GAMM|nr:preprotein translocase subunit SecG [Spiribacter salilacus]MRH77497.1 preprotein translocase subunit SecG [Spiribacter salilacus]
MYTIVLAIHLILAVALIGIVLMQHGKGADAGAAFGSGASSTVFGARGSASFLGRLTGILGILFFITSLTLAIMAGTFSDSGDSVIDRVEPDSLIEEDTMPPVPEDAAGERVSGEEAAPAPAE